MLASGNTSQCITRTVSRQFGVSERMIRKDIARVYRAWRLEDLGSATRHRSLFLRRIGQLSRKAEEAGQFGVALAAEALRLRFVQTVADAPHERDGEAVFARSWADMMKAIQARDEAEADRSRIAVVKASE